MKSSNRIVTEGEVDKEEREVFKGEMGKVNKGGMKSLGTLKQWREQDCFTRRQTVATEGEGGRGHYL